MSDKKSPRWVRPFVDYAPLVAFLGVYLMTRNLQQATWGLVAGSAAALAVAFAVEKRIAPLPLLAGGAGLLFGLASLFFNDPRILKIKPTIMNGLFGSLMLIGLLVRKDPLKLVLGDAIHLPAEVWRRLTINYMLFFFALAGLNEIVWRTQSDDVWVAFRFPGLMILTVIFTLAHTPLFMKAQTPDEAASKDKT
jgi:intracellular septation protein